MTLNCAGLIITINEHLNPRNRNTASFMPIYISLVTTFRPTLGITRPPGELIVHDKLRVAGRVHAVVRRRPLATAFPENAYPSAFSIVPTVYSPHNRARVINHGRKRQGEYAKAEGRAEGVRQLI